MNFGKPLSGAFDYAHCSLSLDMVKAFIASRHQSPIQPMHSELQIPTLRLVAGNWV